MTYIITNVIITIVIFGQSVKEIKSRVDKNERCGYCAVALSARPSPALPKNKLQVMTDDDQPNIMFAGMGRHTGFSAQRSRRLLAAAYGRYHKLVQAGPIQTHAA